MDLEICVFPKMMIVQQVTRMMEDSISNVFHTTKLVTKDSKIMGLGIFA